MKKMLIIVAALMFAIPATSFASENAVEQTNALLLENEALRKKIEELEAQIENILNPPYREIDKKTTGDDVVLLQQRLTDLGFYGGKINGKFDKMTQRAVKAFQRVAGIESNPVATVQLQNLLFSDEAPTPTPSPTPKPTKTPRPAKTPRPTPRYAKIAYKKLVENPADYDGQFITVFGRVLQVVEKGPDLQLRIATKGDKDNVVYVVFFNYFSLRQRLPLDKGDKVTASGLFRGPYQYTSVTGEIISIPSIEAEELF